MFIVSTADRTGEKPRRRARIGLIVLVVIVTAIVTEPIVMYRSLLHQREARQNREQTGLMLGAAPAPSRAAAGR
jgi:hypothetical protein